MKQALSHFPIFPCAGTGKVVEGKVPEDPDLNVISVRKKDRKGLDLEGSKRTALT